MFHRCYDLVGVQSEFQKVQDAVIGKYKIGYISQLGNILICKLYNNLYIFISSVASLTSLKYIIKA